MTDKERIREHLEEFPEESDSQVARYLGVHRKTVWSVRQSMSERHTQPFTRTRVLAVRVLDEYHFLRWPKEPAA